MKNKLRKSVKSVLTPAEVSENLGLSLRLVYRQMKAGVIPSVKVGDRFLIPKVQYERWLSGEQNNTK